MELKQIIGENIKKFRENAGMNQTTLAQKIGKCHTWVSHAEKGRKNFGVETLKDLSVALNCSVDDLTTQSLQIAETGYKTIAVQMNFEEFAAWKLSSKINMFSNMAVRRGLPGQSSDDFDDNDIYFSLYEEIVDVMQCKKPKTVFC